MTEQSVLSAEMMLSRSSPVEVWTPAPIIEAARVIMGGIDLDPASCAAANDTVRATRYLAAVDDGLSVPWAGRVWCNPPFADGGQRRFARHLLHEIERGAVEQAVLLGFWAGGSTWPDEVCASAQMVFHLRQHLPWRAPAGARPQRPNMASFALWVWSPHRERAAAAIAASQGLIVAGFTAL